MPKFALGDVVEIQIDNRLVYVQITHQHASYPPVVRVAYGRFARRPADSAALFDNASAFTTMIPLESTIARLSLKSEIVSHADLQSKIQPFPTFRMPIRDKRGQTMYWWLWNGESLSYDAGNDVANSDLPLREVMSSERFLKQLIEMETRE